VLAGIQWVYGGLLKAKYMIVKIDTRDKDAVISTCIKLKHSYKFYTIENNSNMLQCEIRRDDGEEISGALGYHFGRMVQLEVEIREGKERVKRFPF
jgi:hypothetical protein